MAFYEYSQNNSGGSFVVDNIRGIARTVIVEADDAREADYRAERAGVYFDSTYDCSCCGSRWTSADYWGADKGEEYPSIYSERLIDGYTVFYYPTGSKLKWTDPEGYIHFKDGRIVPIITKTKKQMKELEEQFAINQGTIVDLGEIKVEKKELGQ